MRRKDRKFIVMLDIPERATEAEVLAYLYDAVCTMRGCYSPGDDESDGDPMFDLNPDTVVIHPVGKRTRK